MATSSSSVSSVVNDIVNSTTMNKQRNVGGDMGKNDFLMLLATQLRYQNPLEPTSDAEFASQLAQFTALEQMQNVNTTLAAMSEYQSYSLVGKYVVAETTIDGEKVEVPGTVDCVFKEKGETFVQIGEHAVPVSAIKEVYDNVFVITPKTLIETSNNLIGRHVKGSTDSKELVAGYVTRVEVIDGAMYAYLLTETLNDKGETETKETAVRVETIYNIGEAASGVSAAQKPQEPDDDTDTVDEMWKYLIGRNVIARGEDGITEIAGVIKSIEANALGRWYAYLQGDTAGELQEISIDSIFDTFMDGKRLMNSFVQAIDMQGQTVSGIVSQVLVKDGILYAYLQDDTELYVDNILSVM